MQDIWQCVISHLDSYERSKVVSTCHSWLKIGLMFCSAEIILNVEGTANWHNIISANSYHSVVRGLNNGVDVFDSFQSVVAIINTVGHDSRQLCKLFLITQPAKYGPIDIMTLAKLGWMDLIDICIRRNPFETPYKDALIGSISGRHISLIEKYLVDPVFIYPILNELLIRQCEEEVNMFLKVATTKYPMGIFDLYERVMNYDVEMTRTLEPFAMQAKEKIIQSCS
jgi:hypothetical protein